MLSVSGNKIYAGGGFLSLWEMTDEEYTDAFALLRQVKGLLECHRLAVLHGVSSSVLWLREISKAMMRAIEK
jgi:hypothetical protein